MQFFFTFLGQFFEISLILCPFLILAGHTLPVGVRSHTIWASMKFVVSEKSYSINVNISMHTDLRYFIFKAPWTNRYEMRLVSIFVYNSTILNLRSFFLSFSLLNASAHSIKEKLTCNCSNCSKSQFASTRTELLD